MARNNNLCALFCHDRKKANSTSEPRSGSDRVNLWWHPRIVFSKTYAQVSHYLRHDARVGKGPNRRVLAFPQIDPVAIAPRF